MLTTIVWLLQLFPTHIPDLSFGSPLIISGRYNGTIPELVKVTGVLADMTNFEVVIKVKREKEMQLSDVISQAKALLSICHHIWLRFDSSFILAIVNWILPCNSYHMHGVSYMYHNMFQDSGSCYILYCCFEGFTLYFQCWLNTFFWLDWAVDATKLDGFLVFSFTNMSLFGCGVSSTYWSFSSAFPGI